MALSLDGTTGITSDGGTPVIENLDTTATGIAVTGELTTTGNVGIGTNSPASALDVNGKISLSSGTYRAINYRAGNNDILYEFDGGDFYRQDIGTSSHQFFTGNTERLRIDSAGRVTMPYQPVFSARLSSNQTANSGVAILQFASTDINQGSHFNTSTYRFTAPVAGKYYLNLRQYCNPASGSYVGVYITGTPGTRYAFNSVGNDVSVALTWIVYLAAGDYVEGYYYNSGTYTARTDGTAFEGYLIG